MESDVKEATMSFDDIDRNTNEKPPSKTSSGQNGVNATLIAFVALAVIAVIFVLQNRGEVRTHFLFFTKTSKVWATIGVAIIVGVGLDRLFSLWWRRRKQNKD
jgi:uncharacterized integral membrane protein